jgi:Transcriptional activator of glycolytic enzymes
VFFFPFSFPQNRLLWGALAVGDENNPTKASVESVLPGVHQQFTNLHHEINRVKVGVDDLGTRLEGMTLETRGLLENFGREFTDGIRRTLVRNFVNVAVGLVGETATATRGTPRSPAPSVQSPLRHAESSAMEEENDDDEMPLRPELKNRYRPSSATSIYQEYYGLGEFENVPIAGGLAGMESKYRNKWRLGDPGYQKAYSQMQQISKAVKNEMATGRTEEEVLEEFDALFAGNEKKGLEYMRKLVVHVVPLRVRKHGAVDPTAGPPVDVA